MTLTPEERKKFAEWLVEKSLECQTCASKAGSINVHLMQKMAHQKLVEGSILAWAAWFVENGDRRPEYEKELEAATGKPA
jgi:hypothetical protein